MMLSRCLFLDSSMALSSCRITISLRNRLRSSCVNFTFLDLRMNISASLHSCSTFSLIFFGFFLSLKSLKLMLVVWEHLRFSRLFCISHFLHHFNQEHKQGLYKVTYRFFILKLLYLRAFDKDALRSV